MYILENIIHVSRNESCYEISVGNCELFVLTIPVAVMLALICNKIFKIYDNLVCL